jgi:hypothetical protein
MDLGSETSKESAETARSPIRSRKVFWSVIFLSLFIIAAAVANSSYLESLIGQFEHKEKGPTRTARLAVLPVEATMPPQALVTVPRRLVEEPKPELAAQFLRIWRISGPDMCKALREAGIDMTDWHAPSTRSTSHECYFQRVYDQDGSRPISSIYVKIRGNSKGDILEIKGKINGPVTDDQGHLDPALMRMFETLVQKARWSDFHDVLEPVRNLRDVERECFGASFSFTREAAGENRFNFMLLIDPQTGPQTRTRAYFSPERWVAAPAPHRSADLQPMLVHVQR